MSSTNTYTESGPRKATSNGGGAESRRRRRANVLRNFGAGEQEVEELLAYNENHFDFENVERHQFPLDDEPFVEAWKKYAEEAREERALSSLKHHLVQLQFPIEEGISETEAYRNATLRGHRRDRHETSDTGISLEDPEALQIEIHPTPAGHLPFLITRHRPDFTTLVRALARHNEPARIPESMGAVMVAGYNNWGRIQDYRRTWEHRVTNPTEEKWREEFRRLIPRKSLYQDCFVILSNGPYSSVPAHSLGLSKSQWRSRSLDIRREHESAHYFTRRVLSSMQSNVLDEFIADYMGIVETTGHFRKEWLLQFLGLESFPEYRSGARLENYRGDPPLSESAFCVLQKLVVEAANNVERFCTSAPRTPRGAHALLSLAQLTLEEMASSRASNHLESASEI